MHCRGADAFVYFHPDEIPPAALWPSSRRPLDRESMQKQARVLCVCVRVLMRTCVRAYGHA
eukprot:5596466-Alexandrium_andersonii.AAC.1